MNIMLKKVVFVGLRLIIWFNGQKQKRKCASRIPADLLTAKVLPSFALTSISWWVFLSKYVSVRSAAAGRKGEGTELARLRLARSREQARPAAAGRAEVGAHWAPHWAPPLLSLFLGPEIAFSRSRMG